jgi:hypothetical protein
MAMQETASSLRAYFLLVGAYLSLSAIYTIVDIGPSALVLLFQGVTVLLGLAMLGTGAMAKTLLQDSPVVLFVVVWVAFGWRMLLTLFVLVVGIAQTGTYFDALASILVALYLTFNIRRLSGETDGQAQDLLPGAVVTVRWQDGSHHRATVMQVSGPQVEVQFGNGQRQWVAAQFVTPNPGALG